MKPIERWRGMRMMGFAALNPCYGTVTEVGAGEGNRTLVISLEGFCSTIELHPRRIQVGRRAAEYNIPTAGQIGLT